MTEVDLIGQQAVKGGVGDSDKWITIQQNTFTNWVNLQLHGTELHVEDLYTDLCDGVKLCALVEAIQKKRVGRVIKKPMNQHQYLVNISLALNAITQDNVKLVNIGSKDIVDSNKTLILGLIWHLILHYQIGKMKMLPKKLMLAWLHAVIPDCHINNFTSDWNNGVSLHALIDYCQPGLCSNWKSLSPNNRLENCRDAMMLAKQHFGIPLIVSPEDFCSPHLDELSGMTYLSYYMNVDSPGYNATKRNINVLLMGSPVDNFTTDWNDGRVLCRLVKNLGGRVKGWPHLSNNPEENIDAGIEGARGLGVEPILSAKEMSEAEVEHMGIMAYAAYFTQLTPVKSLAEKAVIDGDFANVYVGQEKSFCLNIDDDVSPGDFCAEVIGPDSLPAVHLNWTGQTAHATFTPSETGQHRLNVYCNSDPIAGCPVSFHVSSDHSKVSFHPGDRSIVGHPTELKVDTSAAGQGDVRVESQAPGGRSMNLPVTYRQGVCTANFTPAEVGKSVWELTAGILSSV
ncbi:filamin-C-like [Gigantopelta aegis]|uniref:filamin-C-like n=1 Tax=Gigantopelta aegis TaxID=1735272 RepID=UPI001B8878B2|nr:filamin-C-like [Gigantopelta aegis]